MLSFYRFRQAPIIKRLVPSIYKIWRKGKTSYKIVVRHHIQWLLYPSSFVDRNLIVWGGWEIEQQARLIDFAKANKADVFIDVGSCFGLYALTLKKEMPSLEVHAFEPHPLNRQQLQANLFINSASDVVVVHDCALGETVGSASIAFISNSNRGAARLGDPVASEHTVQVVPGDDILKFDNKVVVVKIDVEGFEKQVLRGMADLVSRNKCFMQIECLDADNDPELFSLLDEMGLTVVDNIGVDYYVKNF